MRISRKGWRLLLATLLFAFCCLAALYCRFTASKSEVKQAMARVITRVHYELRADGKTVLSAGDRIAFECVAASEEDVKSYLSDIVCAAD